MKSKQENTSHKEQLSAMSMIPIRKLLNSVTPFLFGLNLILLFTLLSRVDLYHRRAADENWNDVPKCRSCQHIPALTPQAMQILQNKDTQETNHVILFKDVYVQRRDIQELHSRQIPNMVYYVWCGNRTFEFRHYLSVLSVWYVLEPDVIEFRYEIPPQEDKYNSWFTRLKTQIPAFEAQSLPPHVKGELCGEIFGLETIYDRGGVYVDIEAVLGQASTASLSQNFSCAGSLNNHLGYTAALQKDLIVRQTISSVQKLKMANSTMAQLSSFIQANGGKMNECVVVSGNEDWFSYKAEYNEISCIILKNSIAPQNVITGNNSAALAWLKLIFYGPQHNNSIMRSQQEYQESHENPVDNQTQAFPFIIHYVWFGATEMTFGMYLSFLSSVYIVKPKAIYIHSDLLLSGSYWDLVKAHPLVHLVYREAPIFIFGHRILYRQHRSDVVRADLLDKYGGIYIDWDAYWVKSPSDLLGDNHEVILSRDHIPRPPFPDTINMGVVMAKPRSQFIRAWRSSLVNYRSHDFLYNAVELPYKMYEMFPDGVFVNDRLQVMCYFLKCHPTFHPEFRHWGQDQPFDWRKDVYAIHFTHPDPPAFANETVLKSSTGMFADIGRHIWNSQFIP